MKVQGSEADASYWSIVSNQPITSVQRVAKCSWAIQGINDQVHWMDTQAQDILDFQLYHNYNFSTNLNYIFMLHL